MTPISSVPPHGSDFTSEPGSFPVYCNIKRKLRQLAARFVYSWFTPKIKGRLNESRLPQGSHIPVSRPMKAVVVHRFSELFR